MEMTVEKNKKYILSSNIGLRSWQLVPFAYYIKGQRNAQGLKKEEYELLLRCDGNQELENSPLLQSLIKRGLCHLAKEGDLLTDWQKLKFCDNRYFPAMNWMITGHCNYNCLHCFNAVDNARIQSEFSIEEARKLIEEAEMCGVNAFTITGGEPMIHPHFMEIIRSIYNHGMYVEELNTNGYFITQDILDEMKEIGCSPLIKISFDGIGHHDWLRNRCGAEEDALRAIRLCVENGFRVKVQTNVHRLNFETMLSTAKMLDAMGVNEMRIIRTTEAPRWAQNAKDACLTLEEYFDRMLEFLKEYIKTDCKMEIDIWQFVHVWMKQHMYSPRAVECVCGEYRDSISVCRGNRGMIAVAADGNLYPCHQMSGYYEQHGWVLGNVKKDGLQSHLRQGAYLQEICTTVKELADHNEKCANCKWFKYCCGGCRAIGLLLTGEKFGEDLGKCLYFMGGYSDKLHKVLHEFYNIKQI